MMYLEDTKNKTIMEVKTLNLYQECETGVIILNGNIEFLFKDYNTAEEEYNQIKKSIIEKKTLHELNTSNMI